MLGQTDAQEFYSSWIKATNRMGSEDMTPHLVEKLNREHPTLRQQMVAMMASLLNMMDSTHIPDDRDAASSAFLAQFKEWVNDQERLYISPKGETRFPFI